MKHVARSPEEQVQWTIDREADLLLSAIYLVAGGGAPSTIVAGLHLGEAALAIAQPIADERGVILEPLWGADEGGYDVRVRRSTPAR